jgi:hypothetical protein
MGNPNHTFHVERFGFGEFHVEPFEAFHVEAHRLL